MEQGAREEAAGGKHGGAHVPAAPVAGAAVAGEVQMVPGHCRESFK
jgi:hypothetical protein